MMTWGKKMPNLLTELEIDAACYEFAARRIVALGGPTQPQPIVAYLDAMPPEDDEPEEDEDLPLPAAPADPWDALTARAAYLGSGPETVSEMTERLLAKMDV